MGKPKPHNRPQNGTGPELTAIRQLLELDLHDATLEQEEAARAALERSPSHLELISVVQQWARALAEVCRSHARDCARAHTNRNDPDPSTSSMGTMLLALSDHLRLPADGTLLFELWPAKNALRDFVQRVSGAPVQLVNGEFVMSPTLPRWEPESRFARRIAGLEPDLPPQDGRFLSIAETEGHFRGLEDLFRKALLEGLQSSSSEAVLESMKKSIAPSEAKSRRPRYRSKFRQAIRKVLLEYPDAPTQAICAYVDEQFKYGRTERSWVSQYSSKTKQHASHPSIICQVKKAMGLI